jgi:hypothetical protein
VSGSTEGRRYSLWIEWPEDGGVFRAVTGGRTLPAKNIHHDAVIAALQADGWMITDDPLRITYGDRSMYVDLGAEKTVVGAEKDNRRIAVEVQSFLGESPVRALQEAVGQFAIYREVLAEQQPERVLYMAVSRETHDAVLSDRFGRFIVARMRLRLIVFNPQAERIVQWIN